MSGKIINRFPAGTVKIPTSKSLGHRALICAALAARSGGESVIEGLGNSEDISRTRDCLKTLGAVFREEKGLTYADFCPRGTKEAVTMDCGESGSTLRFLIPLAALEGGEYIFTGRGRLPSRPMDVYEELFKNTGVEFSKIPQGFRLKGRLPAGNYTLPGNVSSQFITGLLLALPLARGDSRINVGGSLESSAYVDMTLDVMKAFGVEVRRDEGGFVVPGGQTYRPCRYRVEGDYSQAAFFLVSGALGCDVSVSGLPVQSSQGDRAVIGLLEKAGATIVSDSDKMRALPGELRGFRADAREIPDLVPPIAALMCFCRGESRIINAGRLRLKESDRLEALATELGKLGADIRQKDDGLVINGKPGLPGGNADSWGDHRIAMAAAVAAVGCDGPVHLTGWESVGKSYPGFWDDFCREAKGAGENV